MKKIVSFVLTLILLLTVAAGAAEKTLEGWEVWVPSRVSMYMKGNDKYVISANDYYGDLFEDIKIDSFKSSKKNVAEIEGFHTHHDPQEWIYDWNDEEEDYNMYQYPVYPNDTFDVYLKCNRPGTTKISFQCANKKFSTTVKVLAYKNPVASLKITGIEGGRELKAKTAEKSWAEVVVTKNVSKPKLSVKAASGWVISELLFEHGMSGYRDYKFGGEGPTSFSMSVCKLEKNQSYGKIEITFYNKKNDASITTRYTFSEPE